MADLVAFAAVSVAAAGAALLRASVPIPARSGPDAGGKGEAVFSDPNFPRDSEGRVHHLGLRPGDGVSPLCPPDPPGAGPHSPPPPLPPDAVAARILSVGDVGRAERIAALLDDAGTPGAVRKVTSSRGFVTHTGRFGGVPVSIIATGMGTPMMDFVVRAHRIGGGGLAEVLPGFVSPPVRGRARAHGACMQVRETRPLVDGPMAMLRCVTPCVQCRDAKHMHAHTHTHCPLAPPFGQVWHMRWSARHAHGHGGGGIGGCGVDSS